MKQMYHSFHKNAAQLFSTLITNVLNDHVTLKTGVMVADNLALPSEG